MSNEIIKFENFLNESVSDIRNIDNFLSHMQEIVNNLINHKIGEEYDLNLTITLELNEKSKTIELPFHSETYEALEIFLESVKNEDEDLDQYNQSKKFKI